MQRTILAVFILLAFTTHAQSRHYTVANAHSHNDYEQPVPFHTAYEARFGSIEADIFLHQGALIVAHDSSELPLHRTLEEYYIRPLAGCIEKNKGNVFADGSRQLQMMIDIKSDSIATLNELIGLIRKYPMLMNSRSLKWVISGNRPAESLFSSYPSFIWFDGVLSQQYSKQALKKIAMLSDNIRNYVSGNALTTAEWQRLQHAVSEAHRLKKPVRFWGTPDNMDTWDKLMQLQVDYINTDNIAALTTYLNEGPVAIAGKPLPAWKEGYLDLHHINTGRGNAAYYVFPDGTTMLFDAGEEDPTEPRTLSARNSAIRPDSSKHPYEWIAYYISQVAPAKNPQLDYAAISHFHEDHFGSWYNNAPASAHGGYVLTGITGVGELIPIHHLLDRGFPAYDYPVPFKMMLEKMDAGNSKYEKTIDNYFAFIKAQQQRGYEVAKFKAGSKTQIALLHDASKFPGFYVQNVKANGDIWTGSDSGTAQHFPPVDTANPKTWPDENPLSLVFTIHYGPFTYYSGGDCPGNVFYGDAPWRDVETPVARVVGEVDVATVDHHGNRDAANEFQIKTFKPSVWIEQVWSSDHPGQEVLIRLTTPYLYKGPRDLFATNMLEANKLVIGSLIDKSYRSEQGHIVVRVLPDGNDYYVIILDDSRSDIPVKKVFGPYRAKRK